VLSREEDRLDGSGPLVAVAGLGRRVSGYSFSNRSIIRSRVESRNFRRPVLLSKDYNRIAKGCTYGSSSRRHLWLL